MVYFFVFYFLIKKLDLKTPGREDDDGLDPNKVEHTPSGAKEYDQLATKYITQLGGKENIANIDNCVTRLRLEMKDMSKVNEAALKQLGAKGVLRLGATSLQVIIGTDVEFLADAMKRQ